MTRLEKNWILYDAANSSFTLLITTLFPVYFKYLTGKAGLSNTVYMSYWGYMASAATLVLVLTGPVLGAVADAAKSRKGLFTASLLIGAAACAGLGVVQSWVWFFGVFIIAKIGYSTSLIFYDAMLPDITTPENMDVVSSAGYGIGYIGSTVPFLASLAIVMLRDKIGLSLAAAMNISFFLNAVWWVALSLPLLKKYRQVYFVEGGSHPVHRSLQNIKNTLKSIRKEKNIFLFLLAFFLYIDGVYTIIEMSTAYGTAIGLDSTGLLIALLVTQFVAFPFALIFARLSKKIAPAKLIIVCILGYFFIALFAIQLDTQAEFWVLALCVGVFQGGIQALSRSYYGKIIPPEKSGEYFGIMDIFGKGAAFTGTMLVSVITQITGNMKAGVSSVSILILSGLIVFLIAGKKSRTA
ncbi:MAG: MFS transporter [Treponema sp.]|jgi:UMF1 family MFS transporter|nr:MFS transporter [Treponema sp.]